MGRLIFAEKAWEEYVFWQETDRRTLKRNNLLLKDIIRNGNEGIGKPEPLKHLDEWSRRIDTVHRLVYQLNGDLIEILQCKGHYTDKP
ncbi:MAG: Txe/YoeB family addiction module toxin [Treponema sp.]|nr:Txe/YoeB family addiction module toxin [Treponema sp.]